MYICVCVCVCVCVYIVRQLMHRRNIYRYIYTKFSDILVYFITVNCKILEF